jgi:hypothetical protein
MISIICKKSGFNTKPDIFIDMGSNIKPSVESTVKCRIRSVTTIQNSSTLGD